MQTPKNQGLFGKGLSNNRIIDWTKLETFADDILNEGELMISVWYRKENNVGKGENAGNEHFLLFPQCFQKASLSGSFKVETVW